MGRSAVVFEPVNCEPGSCTWPGCSNFLSPSRDAVHGVNGHQAMVISTNDDDVATTDRDGPVATSPRREYRSIAQRRLRSTLLPDPVTSLVNAVADRSNETRNTDTAVAQVSHTRHPTVSHAEVSHVIATGTMLPPRLSTPVPTSRPTQYNTSLDTDTDSPLTSLGRRTLLRAQLGTRLERLDSQIDRGALDRAQHAVDGSRSALSQAREAIRNALIHSERLERIAAVLRRQVNSTTPAEAASARRDLETLDNARSELNLERALADLRAASVEIDRIVALSRDTGITFSDRSSSSGLLGSQSIALPGMPSITVTTSVIRPAAARTTASGSRRHDFASLLGSNIEQSLETSPLRMPTPIRAPNPFGQLSQALVSTSRDPNVPVSSSDRPALVPNTASISRTTNLRDFRISTATDLARRMHEAHQVSRSGNAPSEPSVSHEEGDVRSSIASLHNHQQRQGGWRRLDANGDEIEGEVEDAPGRGLGWQWRPPSPISTEEADTEDDKPAHRASMSLDWISEGRPNRSLLTSEGGTTAYRFNGSREMVGR